MTVADYRVEYLKPEVCSSNQYVDIVWEGRGRFSRAFMRSLMENGTERRQYIKGNIGLTEGH